MYYPLSKISQGLYTSGNEYIISSTGEDYAGYYYAAFDGKYFTEKVPTPSSIELTKISSTSTSRAPGYSPSSYTPTILQENIDKGTITRYFANRVNGDASTIIEIRKEDFDILSTEILYITAKLEWMVSGPLYDSPQQPGVVDTNKRTLHIKEKELPGISKHLHTLTQFYTGQF